MSEIDAKKLFKKALEYYKEEKFDLVEKNFEDALKLAPGRVSILENLASIFNHFICRVYFLQIS